MNYHSDSWVFEQLNRHYNFAKTLYKDNQIVGIFVQGSTNYGLDTKNSDVDTKCLIVPTFKEIALNRKPVSTTNILPNEEHLDAKDIRLYIETFRKQNLNFLEILFTDYAIVNLVYMKDWARLLEHREEIARMNPFRAVKSMKGIANEKYHAMKHPYPSKIELIEKYGYDGKQVHHLLRVEDYLRRYEAGEPYKDCLRPTEELIPRLMDYKNQLIPLEVAEVEAKAALERVDKMANDFCAKVPDKESAEMRELLEDVSYNIMKIAVEEELGNGLD